VVLVEPCGEVTADCVPWLLFAARTDAVGDELQVFFERFLRPCYPDEINDLVGGVVSDAPVRFKQRDDAVVVGLEDVVLAEVETSMVTISVDQPRLVEAVPSHHAADGVGEQPLDVVFMVGAIQRNLVIRHIWRDLTLQTVHFSEVTVILFFQFLHLMKTGTGFSLGNFQRMSQSRRLMLKCR
jgi:hypothetical protein